MDREAYDDLLRRLTALVVKLDARDDVREVRHAQHEAHLIRLDEAIAGIGLGLDELRQLHRQQVAINTRLETLMVRVFEDRRNGHE